MLEAQRRVEKMRYPRGTPTHLSYPIAWRRHKTLSALLFEVRDYARWYEHEFVKRKTGVASQSPQPISAQLLRRLSADQLPSIR